jgi:hypothetical protein
MPRADADQVAAAPCRRDPEVEQEEHRGAEEEVTEERVDRGGPVGPAISPMAKSRW